MSAIYTGASDFMAGIPDDLDTLNDTGISEQLGITMLDQTRPRRLLPCGEENCIFGWYGVERDCRRCDENLSHYSMFP